MRRILLVVESEELQSALEYALKLDYHVYTCSPAEVRGELLCRQYDGLILDLYLQDTDGLTILDQLHDCRPPVIMMLTPFISPYISHAAADLGVGLIIRIPCSVLTITKHLKDMMAHLNVLRSTDAQAAIHAHLLKLGFSPKLDGFRLLQIGIPLYAQDPDQLIVKELYPSIGNLAGCRKDSVEQSIRRAISAAWKNRDDSVWQIYFPNSRKCPTNKEFITTLSEQLR